MKTSKTRVLLVGATGVFGSLLAGRLRTEPSVHLTIAGRTGTSLEALRAKLEGKPDILVMDRDYTCAKVLRKAGPDVVIDAAGPFQESGTALIEACIDAECHYIDLADGRDFVAAISRFNVPAHAAGIAVLSGASSTPALSHAALDHLVEEWQQVDTISVAISPGNQAPRGLSVVRAISSFAGQPVRLFADGAWGMAHGWGLTRKIEFPHLGQRLASLCETPDLDLLVSRYQPTEKAEFLAGLELPILHRGLEAASLLVRAGLIKSLNRFARPLRYLASLFERFGSGRGGMIATASGVNAEGQAETATWWLVARDGIGPNIPTLAVLALVRKIAAGDLDFRGAGPCVGILDLDDFAADFAYLNVESGSDFHPIAKSAAGACNIAPERQGPAHGSPAPIY